MVNRISQKHSKNLYEERREVDAEALIASQMLRRAAMAGLVTLLAGNALWLALSLITGKVYPWFSVLQGIAIGLFTRRWGQGFDWRFPTIAAVIALVGAYSGSFLIAAEVAARDLDTNIFAVLFNVTGWSLGTWLDEVITPADHIFAAYAAILAAFFARRRLDRSEVFALRTMNERKT